MNDPHVVALHFKIVHDSGIDYSRAGPSDIQEDSFDIHVEDGGVRFAMKEHFATEQQARHFVEDYIRSWELDALLRGNPGSFTLEFVRSEVKDRSPTPGVVSLGPVTIRSGVPRVRAQLTVRPPGYPQPPVNPLGRSDQIDAMVWRYVRYRPRGRGLPDLANFCLTVLEGLAGGRKGASKRYGIAETVFGRVGELCANKGGEDARKGKGVSHDFTQNERQFLDQAVKEMIRRAAEFEHDPCVSFKQLTRSDFPRC